MTSWETATSTIGYFWAEHLEVDLAIDSKIFAHKTLNNTFTLAVQLVLEYVCRRKLFQK